MYSPFSRIALFLVAVCGWGVLFFGGWIAFRGVFLYETDPVLMGTGGGLAIGGLLVVALTVGARAQVTTARETYAMRQLMENRAALPDQPAKAPPAAPKAPTSAPSAPKPAKPVGGLRAEPRIGRSKP